MRNPCFRPWLALLFSLTALSTIDWLGWQADAISTDASIDAVMGRRFRVPIELAVMSRCPDARRAEARFDDVLTVVHDIAEVRLLYIADEAQPGNVTCKHGAMECDGNEQQLCAALYGRHASGSPSDLGWSFLMCQNQQFKDVGSPALAEECLQAAAFPEFRAARSRACWSGPEGRHLLQTSAAEARRRGAVKSCTVFIGGDYRCTHDDAEWYDCPGGSEVADFVATVCAKYKQGTGLWPLTTCGPEPEADTEAGLEVASAG